MNAPDPDRLRKRNRGLLLLIFAMFLGSMLVAGALRFSGWQPAGMKNKGALLQPPLDLRTHAPKLASSGSAYAWNPEARTWRVLAVPPAGCAQACVDAARDLDIIWRAAGRNADHLDVLWLCAEAGCAVPAPLRDDRSLRVLAPDAAMRAALAGAGAGPTADAAGAVPAAGGVPMYIVDPNGFVILRYAPGADLRGMREDLVKLLKLV
jgi:hypothetical protein